MTAGTVVITGGILATVILLCIIAVLCYCRLQVLQRDGKGDRVGVEPEGWLCRGSHLTRVQDRVQEGTVRLQGESSAVGMEYVCAVQWSAIQLTDEFG